MRRQPRGRGSVLFCVQRRRPKIERSGVEEERINQFGGRAKGRRRFLGLPYGPEGISEAAGRMVYELVLPKVQCTAYCTEAIERASRSLAKAHCSSRTLRQGSLTPFQASFAEPHVDLRAPRQLRALSFLLYSGSSPGTLRPSEYPGRSWSATAWQRLPHLVAPAALTSECFSRRRS